MREIGKQDTVPLLLEIGCEEIPARFLREAEQGLRKRILDRLEKFLLLPRENQPANQHRQANPIQTFSTPRRLTVYVPEMLARQEDVGSEILGPPVKVALDAEGKYTRAAESFAHKNSASLEDLIRTTTPKGDYLALRKIMRGQPALEKLPLILSGAIIELGTSFPKSMHWSEESKARFVRPIRWILAVLGEGRQAATVGFDVLGVKSGDLSFGHRVYSKRPIRVKSFKDYGTKLRRAFVEFDPENRRQTIRTKTKALLEDSLVLVEDAQLEEVLIASTEWPSAIRGGFDERFLHLPREILITVMRDHQKYFAVENPEGKLEPYFIAILNVDSDDLGLIRRGHERVLQARFRDAEFFWDADQRTPLRERLSRLEKVTYQAELGSYGDKVRRMHSIANRLCDALEAQGITENELRANVLRAVELAKCDLTTQMVQEFAELQGVVGGLYAKAQGEAEAVATAIYDHYLPEGAEDRCPRSLAGALVSLADKLDAVVAGFAVGNEPTGSSDPFAIRRQANGAVRVLLELSASIALDSEIELELKALHEKLSFDMPKVFDALAKFMRERLAFHLEAVLGLRYDTVRAAMEARAQRSEFEPLQTAVRAKAIERIRSSQDFYSLSQSAKRIRNILNKSAKPEDYQGRELDPARLEAGAERDLYDAYQRVRDLAAGKRAQGDISGALETIASLRASVDTFFDNILVLAEDPEVRRNRLQLLSALDLLFAEDADLSQIERAAVGS